MNGLDKIVIMDEVKNKIRDYWNKRSSTFDLSPGHVVSSKREEDAWKSLLKRKLGDDTESVLDVGAGTGFLSIMLAEMGYEVVGLDISEEMLRRARKKAADRGVKVEFKLGDAEDLPFDAGSFDAVVNRAVLWSLPNPEKAIREWKRVLKHGGRLCFFLHEPHAKEVSQILRRQIGNFLILLVERRNPWNSLYNGKMVENLPFRGGVEPAVILDLLERVGFEGVSAETMEEISKLQREKMPLRYKIAHSNHSQFCYTALKPKGGDING